MAILDQLPNSGYPGDLNDDPYVRAHHRESVAALQWTWDTCDSAEELLPDGTRLLGARLPLTDVYTLDQPGGAPGPNPAEEASTLDPLDGIESLGLQEWADNMDQPGDAEDEPAQGNHGYRLLELAATVGGGGNARHEITLRLVLPDGSVSPEVERMALSTNPTEDELARYSTERAEALLRVVQDATMAGWFNSGHSRQCFELRQQEEVLGALDFEPETPQRREHSWLGSWALALEFWRIERRGDLGLR